MKPAPYLLPPVGSTDAFAFGDRDPELFTVDAVDFKRSCVRLSAGDRDLEVPLGEALWRRRPRSVRAWSSQIAKDYTMSAADRAALIGEGSREQAEPMPALPLTRAAATFSKGERVLVARKVESTDGVRTHWAPTMDALVGRDGTFLDYTPDGEALVSIDGSGPNREAWAWSFPPESLETVLAQVESKAPEFKVGDRVRVLRRFACPELGWEPEMDDTIGKVGTVVMVGGSAAIKIDFGRSEWWFSHDVLALPSEGLKPRTKVRVARKLEPHAGTSWLDDMDCTLGEAGEVEEVFAETSGTNISVNLFRTGQVWTYAAESLDTLPPE